MATKGKMALVLAVAVGSSIQIAAGMIPLLVLIAWPMGKDLTLFFVSPSTRLGMWLTRSGQFRDNHPVRLGDAGQSPLAGRQVQLHGGSDA